MLPSVGHDWIHTAGGTNLLYQKIIVGVYEIAGNSHLFIRKGKIVSDELSKKK